MISRVRVALLIQGIPQYYQRDAEVKHPTTGKWFAQPQFVLNSREAAVMQEDIAHLFVKKLKALGVSPWLENAVDGKRIETRDESQNSSEDHRRPVRATPDNENDPNARWYLISPIARPEGKKWLLRCDPPQLAPQLIYADSPEECLNRANDLRLLPWGQLAPAPEAKKTEVPAAPVSRVRPGSRYF